MLRKIVNSRKCMAFIITVSVVLTSLTPAFADPSTEVNWEVVRLSYNDAYKEAGKVADRIIADTITDDMNELEKAYYIYEWLSDEENVKYSHFSANNLERDYIYINGGFYVFEDSKQWYMDSYHPAYPALSLDELKAAGYEILDLSNDINPNGIYIRCKDYSGICPYIDTPRYLSEGCLIVDGWVYEKDHYDEEHPMIGSKEFEEKGFFAYDQAIYKKADVNGEPDDYELEVYKKYSIIHHQSAYGALVQRCCVCAGYADAYEMFMDKLEIPCTAVGGVVPGGIHEVNRIWIKGKMYYVDATNGWFMLEINDESGTVSKDVMELYEEIYGTEMPRRTVNGKEYGGSYYNPPEEPERTERDDEYVDNNKEGNQTGTVSESGIQPIETHYKDAVDVGSILLPYYTKMYPDAIVKKMKFKSSNKKVAKVNKKGIVKGGKQTGSASITMFVKTQETITKPNGKQKKKLSKWTPAGELTVNNTGK